MSLTGNAPALHIFAIASRLVQRRANGVSRLHQPCRGAADFRRRHEVSIEVTIGGQVWPAIPFVERFVPAVFAGQHDFRIAINDSLDVNQWREIAYSCKNINASAQLNQLTDVMRAIDGI